MLYASPPRPASGAPRRHPHKGRLAALLALGVFAATSVIAIDEARSKSKVDEAIAKYGVTGRNAIVAILDRGIDWRNADFRHADGTTRIEYIFDLSDNSGASDPDNGYGRGTVYTKAEINAALASGGTLNTRDAVGHGTTTSAIAAGGGRNDARYRGIAPDARLIVVKFTSEGAPAHGNEPAEAAFYDPAAFPVAVDFVIDKAAELDLPVVMLANFGRIGGPGDGTSRLARTVEAAVGPGKPGVVFVTGSSDDGDGHINNHAGETLAQGETKTIAIEKVATGTMVFDLWYAETDRFSVRVITPGGTFGPYAAPTAPGGAADFNGTGFALYHRGRDVEFAESTNDQRQLYIQFTGAPGTYQVELTGTTVAGDGRFDAALSPSTYANGNPVNHFTNFAAPGTIWEMAAAPHNICPNSYINWTTYTDIDGVERTVYSTPVGELWPGSGVGPTWDGRQGIDVSAPGDGVITTYSPTSYWATFRFNTVASAAGLYGRASAVSAAAPQVTGIIALMLDMDPTLDAAEVKQILRETAAADAFTGAVPNNRWGHGKVDALAALDRIDELRPLAITTPPAPATTTAGGVTTLSVAAEGGGARTYQWQFKAAGAAEFSDLAGATGPTYTIPSTQAFQSGEYRVVVTSGGTSGASVASDPVVVAVDAPAVNTGRLLNLSTRAQTLTGDNILIPGFVVSGTGTKRLLIRAVGPTLAQSPYNVAGTLSNPRMALKRLDFAQTPPAYVDIAENDDWEDNANATEIADAIDALFAFPFGDERESALLVDLIPGQYTVFADGVNAATGVAIVEVYDADGGSSTSTLVNISNRGFVGTGDTVMIPGFVVSSEGPKTLLVRVVGPTLAHAPYNVPGTMVDPRLQLFRTEANGSNTLLLTQDDWNDNPDAANTRQTADDLGAFALDEGSTDAAFVVTLPPGTYTVVGSSADGTSTGVVLVEVYVVP